MPPRLIGITPFERPDPSLAEALIRGGALGVLDLGRDRLRSVEALDQIARRVSRFGVRIPDGLTNSSFELPDNAATILVCDASAIAALGPRRVLVQVSTIAAARAAVAAGAGGLIAKGCESGGLVSEETSFVLLQRLVAEGFGVPIWVQGGVGLHTVGACLAGGAYGVVLDSQLALLAESSLPPSIKDVIAAADGSETTIDGGRRVHARLALPVGQDAVFARPLAARFQTARRLVRGLLQAADGHLRQARALDPLGSGSPFCADHGLRYPIAQGPMTRVSDRAPFAGAVAEAGALPFLALSLMRAPEVRALLAETRDRLGERPWGVGILGFVPPELRDEQLAVVREFRPSVALIAGGRPGQARALEDTGIATYLHVPSPGLLDQFLKDGARRFVFEGRECGGHVGPRTSFVLWDTVVERLLAEPSLDGTSAVFAGGIHDGRSAAMVAALAAPLAARGARIGVLAGTAYLFTEEAVASGAILPGYQQAALECDDTTLLETGPGHSTRCAESDYVRAFRAERARLEGEGVEPRAMWEALEQLNLGRLRMAAKGLVRDGSEVHAIEEHVQRRDGMFMIGQVAALRRATCSVAALHDEISAGSTRVLAQAPTVGAPAGHQTDVAIIGMASLFPGAPDLPSFWANIVAGRNSITEVPPERWNADTYYDPHGTGDKTPSKWGGFLADVPFDPAAYGIPPRSLAAIEPVQLLALEVARRALDDAGYGDRPFDRERASVIFGAEAGTELSAGYGFRARHPQMLGPLPDALDAALPRLTEDSFAGVLANVIAGRIANRLDLGGVNYTVDAACASSLAAVDAACKELVAGTSDLVLCGGADLHNSVDDYLLFASVHALSPTGQCRPFDAAADGIALGEGVAAVVLKRLVDAERDGDRIYAVIKGVGGSSDGKSLGLTAPRKDGQLRAIERAYERAGVSPADVGLVEAHGTGTVVGDRTELAALTDIWSGAGALPGTVTLGSVKSQIGHTKCTAGMAGLIKATLAVHHGVLPPIANLKQTNPGYDERASPFVFRDTAAPWLSDRRRAAVSAFGFGGTNFHVILENARDARAAEPAWPCELVVIRGADRDAARRTAETLRALAAGGHRLRDLARSAAAVPGPVWLAVVADSSADLAAKLREPRLEPADAGPIAFLFPGQGSQRPSMLADLFVALPGLQCIADRVRTLAPTLFPGAALTPARRAAQRAAVTDTRVAQPALAVADLAVARLLERLGVRPAMTAGHSFGELVALTIAGAIAEADLVPLSEARAQAIAEAAGSAPGSMAAVGAPADTVRGLVGADVTLANLNAPDQTVIAGSDAAIERAVAAVAAAGLSSRTLPVACAFHSPIMAGAAEAFAGRLSAVDFHAPALPVYSNSSASPYPAGPADVRARLAEQIVLPVRFAEQIEAMYAAGARVFVEVGPGAVLTDLVGRILRGRPHVAIACAPHGQPALRSLLDSLARLLAAGVPVDVAPLFEGRDARLFDLDSPPNLALAPTAWLVNGHRARPVSGELPDFAMKPITEPIAPALPAVPAAGDREATVLEYLQMMRSVVESQTTVMLRFLGGTDAAERLAEPAAASVAAGAAPPARRAAASARATAAADTAVAVAEPEPVAEPASPAPPADPLSVLIGIISERTGYPTEMLDPDLDLEADLGIDSIKRVEILGTLGERWHLPAQSGNRSDLVEKLAPLKTMRQIAESLSALGSAPASPGPDAGRVRAATDAPAPPVAPPEPAEGPATSRYVFTETAVEPPAGNPGVLRDRVYAIAPDDGGVADELRRLLSQHGATGKVLDRGEPVGPVHGFIHLESLSSAPADDPCRSLYRRGKEVIESGVPCLYAASARTGAFGDSLTDGTPLRGGIAGFVKTVAKEVPAMRARVVDLDAAQPASDLAAALFRELITDDRLVEVGYAGLERRARRLVLAEPKVNGSGKGNGNGHGGGLALGSDSVILITGGARGITAAVAIALATRYHCRLELVGRSPLPEPEPRNLEECPDAAALRVELAKSMSAPAPIEARVRRILAGRETRETLMAIERAGGCATYHVCDVRDASFGDLIDGIYAREGRIDGVIHGAGVTEDKRLVDKTPESFDRVFETKVQGARILAERLRSDVGFVLFFASVVGAFGNPGQADYAAANDALDGIARHLSRRLAGRVVSIDWGPWAGAGMVTPELQREYARRGIGLIPLDEGVKRALAEIEQRDAAQVIIMHRSAAEVFAS